MRVEAVSGLTARCQALGIERQVSLLLLGHDPPTVGEYVMVHLGQAIQKVAEAEARQAWQLYAQIMAELGTTIDGEPFAASGED
jgi:hydrogenase expression/formation protein HypC